MDVDVDLVLDICQLNILQLYKFVYLYLFRHRSVLTLLLSYHYLAGGAVVAAAVAALTASLRAFMRSRQTNEQQTKQNIIESMLVSLNYLQSVRGDRDPTFRLYEAVQEWFRHSHRSSFDRIVNVG